MASSPFSCLGSTVFTRIDIAMTCDLNRNNKGNSYVLCTIVNSSLVDNYTVNDELMTQKHG